jgi:hypothetical protein
MRSTCLTVALVLAAGVVPSGCLGDAGTGNASAPTKPPHLTSLTITATWTNALGTTKRTSTIRCEPPGGDVRSPAVGCFRLAAQRSDFFGTPSFEIPLHGGGGVILVQGVYAGRPVRLTYRVGQYPQSYAWAALTGGGSIHGDISRPGIRPRTPPS